MGSGYRTFASGEVLTAANIMNYLMSQSVAYFNDAAARNSAIGSPAQGQAAYVDDNDQLTIRKGSAWWPAGPFERVNLASEVVLRGSSTDPDLGTDGQVAGASITGGGLTFGWARFLFGTSGASFGAGSYYISGLPVGHRPQGTISQSDSSGRGQMVGSGWATDVSAISGSKGIAVSARFTGGTLLLHSTDGGTLSPTVPFTFAASDIISCNWMFPSVADTW